MGVEDTASRGLFHKTTLKHKGTVFSIDTRGQVLTSQLETPIIVPHTASKTRVSINDIYKSKVKTVTILKDRLRYFFLYKNSYKISRLIAF